MKYSLAKESWDDKEYKSLQRVIDSNMFTMGSEVFKCEEKFAAWVRSNCDSTFVQHFILSYSSIWSKNEIC